MSLYQQQMQGKGLSMDFQSYFLRYSLVSVSLFNLHIFKNLSHLFLSKSSLMYCIYMFSCVFRSIHIAVRIMAINIGTNILINNFLLFISSNFLHMCILYFSLLRRKFLSFQETHNHLQNNHYHVL